MKYDLENHLPYALLAIFALAVFYGIYFAKMLAQKRRGIQTQLLSIVFDWSYLPANARFAGILCDVKSTHSIDADLFASEDDLQET